MGNGIFKEASSGRIERRAYLFDEVEEVLEVIEEGNRGAWCKRIQEI